MAGTDPDTVIHQARLAEFATRHHQLTLSAPEAPKTAAVTERWYDHNQARDIEIRRSSALVAYAA